MIKKLCIAAILSAACAGSGLDRVRYKNTDPVWVVNDRLNVPESPRENKFVKMRYHLDGFYHRRFVRWTEMEADRRALNTNSLGEVPDSTWFTNRIGRRDMSADEVRRGPNREPGPMAHKPWKILSSKVGGVSIGFIIEDTVGDRYLLKFDMREFPEMETGADVILARLFHAVGFNVPEDYIVSFRPGELVIAEGAVTKNIFGEAKPLTRQVLEASLAEIDQRPDQTIRGLTSRFVDGKPLGGWAREGTRADDPNDVIGHEYRRDIRGAYTVFSWLDHTDIKEDNTLDLWVEDPADPAIHYVAHYYIDFGKALGVQEATSKLRYISHSYLLDFTDVGKSLLSFGLVPRRWESRALPPFPGVGLYAVDDYDPGAWKTYTPSYFPVKFADRWDNFWAAKIIMRFTEPQLRAVVSEARLSDPRASEYLAETLVGRQRKTGKYWFSRVNPLDRFEVDGARLCFDDLLSVYRLDVVGARYSARGYDYDGRPTGLETEVVADPAGRACVDGLAPTGSKDGYLIVELTTRRPGRLQLLPTLVHLAQKPATGQLRIIGVRRL
jgi:hypothetical protein